MPSPMRSSVESDIKAATRLSRALLIAAAALLLVPQVRAQANSSAPSSNSSSVIPAMRSDHFTWIEQFDGSSNTEGQVTLLDSSVGYLYGHHLFVDAGVPVYFVRANRSEEHTSELQSLTN